MRHDDPPPPAPDSSAPPAPPAPPDVDPAVLDLARDFLRDAGIDTPDNRRALAEIAQRAVEAFVARRRRADGDACEPTPRDPGLYPRRTT
jgi:hypothetical protein